MSSWQNGVRGPYPIKSCETITLRGGDGQIRNICSADGSQCHTLSFCGSNVGCLDERNVPRPRNWTPYAPECISLNRPEFSSIPGGGIC